MGKQYKIYRETNYIRVIDTTTNELFNGTVKDVFVDKSNTQKNIYRLFNVKDLAEDTVFSIPDILKANGIAYSVSEWETFYTENTGNFNGGGAAPTGVQSVTGVGVDNTDPLNPIITSGVNSAFVNKAYSATMSVPFDSANPNFEIDLTGNLNLTIMGTENGDSGMVNLYFSGTEVATINGIKGLSLTGTGVMIPICYIHDTDGIKWYDAREAVNPNLSAYSKHIIRDLTPSTAHTGTPVETIIKTYLIPANTFSAEDVLKIVDFKVNKTGTNGTLSYRVRINTTASLTDSTSIAYKSAGGTTLFSALERTFTLTGGLIKGLNGSQSLNTDKTDNSSAILSASFNPAIDNYLITTIQLGNAADSATQQDFIVTN